MALSTTTYALAKKYTDESLIGMGALKGAPCKVKSVNTVNDQVIVTLEWKDDLDNTHESEVVIQQGTPIYNWTSGYSYKYGDLAIYAACFYRCTAPNNDIVFDSTKWAEIGSPDGNYDIIETAAQLPSRFTAADRKMYYVINENLFYLWNGTQWVPQDILSISNEEIDALFNEI